MTRIARNARTTKRTRKRAAPVLFLDEAQRIRWSKVTTARARIAFGYYERDDVQEALAEAVLEELNRR